MVNLTYEDAVYCGGEKSARVRVRVKEWKSPLYKPYRYPVGGIPRPTPSIAPMFAKSKCARCGIVWHGPMAYCCPHGSMCGVPRDAPLPWVGWTAKVAS